MNQDPSWGNQIIGPLPESVDDLSDVLINNNLGPQPAAHGVLLFRERATDAYPPATEPLNAALYADVTIGAGAASTNFLCDWSGQFSVVCSEIQIRARSYAPRASAYSRGATVGGQLLERFKHGAFLGFGGWNAAKPLTLTQREIVLDNSVTSVWNIAVPKFARRYFPRFGRVIGDPLDVESPATSIPWWKADIETLQLSISRVGTNPDNNASAQMLTVDRVHNGIDVSEASTLQLWTRTTGVLSTTHFLTSVFELAL